MWRVPLTDKRFGRKLRRMSKRQTWSGNMSIEDRDKIIEATRDDKWLREARSRVEAMPGRPWGDGPLDGFDWSILWEWLGENWPEIVKMLLTIIPLFVEVPDADRTS